MEYDTIARIAKSTDRPKAMIESTSPTVAMVRREIERRPRADKTIPTIEIGGEQNQKNERTRLTIPRTSPAIANPLLFSGGAMGAP